MGINPMRLAISALNSWLSIPLLLRKSGEGSLRRRPDGRHQTVSNLSICRRRALAVASHTADAAAN